MSFKEEYSEYLEHYGVKGMRWGVRKSLGSLFYSKRLRTKAIKSIQEKKRLKNKEQQIKERESFIKRMRELKLNDFIREEKEYLRETGNLDRIKGLGNNKKKWEQYRKAVIEYENKKLTDLRYW